jgi:hypothetical protein
MIVAGGINPHQPVLCDVVESQIRGEYRSGASLAEGHSEYFGLVAQGAFCALVDRDVERAARMFESGRFVGNSATWWLRGLIAKSQQSEAVYAAAMRRAVDRELSDDEIDDPLLPIAIWATQPEWISVFPAFYFPVLPAALTGLNEDLTIRDHSYSSDYLRTLGRVSFPEPSTPGLDMKDAASRIESEPASPRSVVNVYGPYVAGDMDSSGGVVVSGSGVHAGSFAIRGGGWPGGVSGVVLLRVLRSIVVRFDETSEPVEAGSVGALRDALSAAEQGDVKSVESGLKRAGLWALNLATATGAGVLSSAIGAVLGIGLT